MIHQVIFAAPRPGMSEQDFQDYWLNVHATEYAAKIPQIRRYAIDTRIPQPEDDGEPLWSGIAEIWLENDEEQLASLQTKEFIEGARADEPRWAAFWRTVVIDTDTEMPLAGEPQRADEHETKLVVLAKRREGLSLQDFRRHSREVHASLVLDVPGVRRYYQCYVMDSRYALSEPPFDVAYQIFFADVDAARAARRTPEFGKVVADYENFVHPRYRHELLVRQNWVIGPEAR